MSGYQPQPQPQPTMKCPECGRPMRVLPLGAGFYCPKRHEDMRRQPNRAHKFRLGRCEVCRQAASDCMLWSDEHGIFDACPGPPR